MHLLNTYALACGVKIDKPFIYEKYFPIPPGDYITFHASSKASKTYDRWQVVMSILSPILEKVGIKIIQIGQEGDNYWQGAINLIGKTNINQTAYIIRNSVLHLGVDSFPIHMASSYNKKIVGLYSNNYIENVGPYWGNKENQILLHGIPEGQKPSFSLHENPKTINNIKPEEIVKAVCKLLEIDYSYPFETVYFGLQYHHVMIENVPHQVVDCKQFGVPNLIIRMDFHFDENILSNQLSVCPCVIVTNKPINPDILRKFKSSIIEIIYIIDENHNPEFAKQIQLTGISFKLLTSMDEDQLKPIKLDYFDIAPIYTKSKTLPKEVEENLSDDLYYTSNRFILGNEKIYASQNGWMVNDPLKTFVPEFKKLPTKYLDIFNEEAEYFYFVRKIKQSKI